MSCERAFEILRSPLSLDTDKQEAMDHLRICRDDKCRTAYDWISRGYTDEP